MRLFVFIVREFRDLSALRYLTHVHTTAANLLIKGILYVVKGFVSLLALLTCISTVTVKQSFIVNIKSRCNALVISIVISSEYAAFQSDGIASRQSFLLE